MYLIFENACNKYFNKIIISNSNICKINVYLSIVCVFTCLYLFILFRQNRSILSTGVRLLYRFATNNIICSLVGFIA